MNTSFLFDQDRDTVWWFDGFCGAGGASEGIERAGQILDGDGNVIAMTNKVAVAVNHDERAIWAHNANHPNTMHLNTDIRLVDVADLARRLIQKGISRLNIWWSAECTHFSNAKGGASRDADSRMLSEELLRYVREFVLNGIQIDWIMVENVKEFFSWTSLLPKYKSGKRLKAEEKRYARIQIEMFDAVANHDLELKARLADELDAIYAKFQAIGSYDADDKGKITMLPDASTKGLLYLRWCQALKDLGYRYQNTMLNAADLGAYQSRERYFGVFCREEIANEIAEMGENPIKFPALTHSKNPRAGSLFESGLLPWKACREILDLDDKGESILYGRKKKRGKRKGEPMPPLCPATLKRIAFGIMKFKGDGVMIDRSNTGASPTNANDPLPTVRASYENAAVQVSTVDSCTFGQDEVSVNGAMPTVMAKRDKYLMNAFVVPFIANQFGSGDNCSSINAPLWAIVTNPKGSLVVPFLAKYYGNGDNATSIESPCGTVTTKDRLGLAQCQFLANQFGGITKNGTQRVVGLDQPITTVTTSHLPTSIQCDFVSIYHGGDRSNRAIGMGEPLRTLTTENRAAITLTQIMAVDDHWPIVLQQAPKPTANGNVIVPAWTRVINGYQVDNRIIDVHYRMLKVSELKLAQGFPSDYILDPTSETVAKKHLGNAVHVLCSEALARVNCGPQSAYARYLRQKSSCAKSA